MPRFPITVARALSAWAAAIFSLSANSFQAAAAIQPDLSGYSDRCGIQVTAGDGKLFVAWPAGDGSQESMAFDLRDGSPLISKLGGSLAGIDPLVSITAGTRQAPSGRPKEMSIWNTFFDNPHKRPHQAHLGALVKKRASAASEGRRATVTVGDVAAGPFRGEFCFTFFAGSPLVKMEAVMSTDADRTAFVFDLGLVGAGAGWRRLAWTDVNGEARSAAVDENAGDQALAVRHRMIAAEGSEGSVAVFPPPHAFFYPLDWTNNTRNIWHGRGHQGEGRFGIGVRHDPRGAGNFVPWFNAPPGTRQRLALFLLPHRGDAAAALAGALRFTRGDRFPPLPGMSTFSSHYHMAVAMTAKEQLDKGVKPLPVPDLVKVFKDMGVQAVHLGEFHGDGHQDDPGPLRLPEMRMMFAECERLSDDELLLIPGEEINTHLGIPFPGRHPGHWMLLFPRPVYWTKVRGEGQPFEERHPDFGTVYHAGSRADMVEVIKREHGLAWTAHPRIKASSWAPDSFKNEAFFKDGLWLGAAFKAMPADLSRERLGERCLGLLDDMCNWGERKYLPGEVDTFKLDRTHELYGHMNINYLRLPRMPRYRDGWQPVLDALRRGAFFTTTGEVLIKSFSAGGRHSGETAAGGRIEIKAEIEWTFPMKFAEIISGDGRQVFRVRIGMADTEAFGSRIISLPLDLANRSWVRLEAWDVAANGAYTQPVWLEPAAKQAGD